MPSKLKQLIGKLNKSSNNKKNKEKIFEKEKKEQKVNRNSIVQPPATVWQKIQKYEDLLDKPVNSLSKNELRDLVEYLKKMAVSLDKMLDICEKNEQTNNEKVDTMKEQLVLLIEEKQAARSQIKNLEKSLYDEHEKAEANHLAEMKKMEEFWSNKQSEWEKQSTNFQKQMEEMKAEINNLKSKEQQQVEAPQVYTMQVAPSRANFFNYLTSAWSKMTSSPVEEEKNLKAITSKQIILVDQEKITKVLLALFTTYFLVNTIVNEKIM